MCGNAESFDSGQLWDDLAAQLGVPGPLDDWEPFNIFRQDPDFSGWLESTLWKAMEEGKAVLPRTLKLRILAGVYFAEDYQEFESVQEDWDLILDRFNAIEPVLSDDEIDEFYEKHPEVAILGL